MTFVDGFTQRLPEWMRSARFRIAILYSTVLFLLAAFAVGALYMALVRSVTDDPPMNSPIVLSKLDVNHDGEIDEDEVIVQTNLRQLLQLHQNSTIHDLKNYSFIALGGLFVVSLGVGWVISGRVLRPIDRITDVANHIQATDLSQRIELRGPSDELKRLADTFDQMLDRLDKAFSMQRGFIADASHELRNPLAIIKTSLDVVLADPNAGKEELQRTAVVVRRATERMARLVDDLFALARLEGRSTVQEEVALASLVVEVAEEFEVVAAQNRISFATNIAPVEVRADRDALKRAAANLIDNAIRFAPADSTIEVATGSRDGWAWVAVKDRGPGIAPEDQPRVFDRFWRADRSRSREQGGTGLGLAIAQEITRAHAGEIKLFSEPGMGSTFVIWIPAFEEARRARRSPPPPFRPLAVQP